MYMMRPADILDRFQTYLDGLDIPVEPEGLYAPVRYALSLGGKRMRPLLMALAYNLYKEDVESCFDAACGIEIFHNFTLLHDDVMDRAEMRRGMPVVHVKWNENTAILSGDVMLVLAYKCLGHVPEKYLGEVMEVAGEAFIGVHEGQQLDMDFESRNDVTIPEYMEMIRLKTSVLPAAALRIGAIIGGAPESDAKALYGFGEKMGLAFQLRDDLLDVYGDSKVFGKRIGGDILCNKKTFLYIMARELAGDEHNAALDRWAEYDGPDEQAKISAVTSIYNELGVRGRCEGKIDELYREALSLLDKVSLPAERLATLRDYACSLIDRQL